MELQYLKIKHSQAFTLSVGMVVLLTAEQAESKKFGISDLGGGRYRVTQNIQVKAGEEVIIKAEDLGFLKGQIDRETLDALASKVSGETPKDPDPPKEPDPESEPEPDPESEPEPDPESEPEPDPESEPEPEPELAAPQAAKKKK